MEDYTQFVITIEAYDDRGEKGPRAVVTADVADGDPMIVGMYFTSEERNVDVRRPFRDIDFDQVVAMLPKAGTVYEQPILATVPREVPSIQAQPFTPATPELPREDRQAPDSALLDRLKVGTQPRPVREGLRTSEQVAQDLRNLIATGVFPPDSYLPERFNLVRTYPDASAYRVDQAIKMLRAEGLLTFIRGEGTRVNHPVVTRRIAAAAPEPAPAPRQVRGNQIGRGATRGTPSPDGNELLAKLEELGTIKAVAEHYGVKYQAAHGWIRRAERNKRLGLLPIVEKIAS